MTLSTEFGKLIFIFFLFFCLDSNAQKFDSFIKKVDKASRELERTTKEVNKTFKDVNKDINSSKKASYSKRSADVSKKQDIDGVSSSSTISSRKKGHLSSSGYENVTISPNEENSYYKVANDFYIDISDIKSKYPQGYNPKWDLIDNSGLVNFNMTTYNSKAPEKKEAFVTISEFNGEAYVFLSKFLYSSACAGKLVSNGNQVLITERNQSFYVDKFYNYEAKYEYVGNRGKKVYKVLSTPCISKSGSVYDAGGWRLNLDISKKENSSLLINAKVESILINEYIISKRGVDFGKRYEIEGKIFENKNTPEQAIATKKRLETEEEQRRLTQIAYENKKKEESRLFEIRIKDSFAALVKEQGSFENSRYGCLKVESGEREVTTYETVTYQESPRFRDRIGPDGSIVGTDLVEQGIKRDVMVPKKHNESYKGYKNVCSKPVTIMGAKKMQSEKGTIYYVDASVVVDPGEMTEDLLKIEDNYNPKASEIGSIHYYKNKLPLK